MKHETQQQLLFIAIFGKQRRIDISNGRQEETKPYFLDIRWFDN